MFRSNAIQRRWADPERVGRAVRDHAEVLRRRDPAITRILWYGSWVNGIPTPRSDVDLCVVLAEDDRPPRERTPEYLPERFPTGIDLLVLTEEELAELESRASDAPAGAARSRTSPRRPPNHAIDLCLDTARELGRAIPEPKSRRLA